MRLATTTLRTTLFFTLTTTATLPAQVTLRNTGRELKDGVADIFYVWTSPVRADRNDWAAALGVGVGAAALMMVDDQVDSWIVRHPNSAAVRATIPWNEDHPEFGDLSTGQRLLPISAVLIASGMVSDNRKLREAGWGCLSAWQASSVLRTVLYETVSRERPSLDNGDQYAIKFPGGDWEHHSFIGGHAANAVACATFWNTRFKMGVFEPVLYTTALGISLSRMADRRHWASDTWVGMAVGYAMGRTIAARYERREAKREKEQELEQHRIRASLLEGLQISPAPGGLLLRWSGNF